MSFEAMDKPRDQTPQLKNQSDSDKMCLNGLFYLNLHMLRPIIELEEG